MRYTFTIPPELEMRLKLVAVKQRRSLQSIGLEATETYVAAQEQKLAEAEAKPEAIAA